MGKRNMYSAQIHPANVSLPDSPVNVPGFENFSFSSEPLTLS